MRKAVLVICAVFLVSLTVRFVAAPELDPKQARLWMLDVGQGEAALVRTSDGRTLLFDGGPGDRVVSELGSILPPWQRSIDAIVLSHPHADHIRGLIAVLDRMDVGEIWSSGATHATADYAAWQERIALHNVPEHHRSAGWETRWGETTFRTLHPLTDMAGASPRNAHDANLVLQVEFGTKKVLLTGDLNDNHERGLVAQCGKPCTLQSDILQVPHHGSASGLEPEFLDAVRPQVALIPVGANNRFSHPRAEITDRLEAAGIPIFRTDTDGRIAVQFGPDGIAVSTSKSNRTLTLAAMDFGPGQQLEQSQRHPPHHPAWAASGVSESSVPCAAFGIFPPCRSLSKPFLLPAA